MSQLGSSYTELLVKDLAPTVCALMLSTRVGAGIAAEIGSMVVTEQVDALRMCAADPVDYLIRPRFVASLLMTPILVSLAAVVAYGAGMATANGFFDVSPSTFANFSVLDRGDFIVGLSKCLVYGATIPVVSGYCGLTCSGGSEGVGSATTRAVVSSCLWVIVLDFVLSAGGYLVFQ
jgi:phospholipid/cholesterol/gamma-HCH transport system permease protein